MSSHRRPISCYNSSPYSQHSSHSHYSNSHSIPASRPEIRYDGPNYYYDQNGYTYPALALAHEDISIGELRPRPLTSSSSTQDWLSLESASLVDALSNNHTTTGIAPESSYTQTHMYTTQALHSTTQNFGEVASSDFLAATTAVSHPWDPSSNFNTMGPGYLDPTTNSSSSSSSIYYQTYEPELEDIEDWEIKEQCASASHSPQHNSYSSPDHYHTAQSNSSPLSTTPGIHSFPYRCPCYLQNPSMYPACKDLTFRYICRIKGHLAKHMLPFECSVCFKRFSTLFSLKRHRDPGRVTGCVSGRDSGKGITDREREMHRMLDEAETVEAMVEILERFLPSGHGRNTNAWYTYR